MEHVIYDNYSLYDNYDDTKQFIIDEYPELCTVEVEDALGHISYEPTDNKVWDFIYDDDQWHWDEVFHDLKQFFADKQLIMFGSVGRWNGKCSGFDVGTFEDLFYNIVKDCDYIKFTDEDGHFCLECSHHDGTNCVEFRELTRKGYEVYDRWEYGYGKFADYEVSDIGELLTKLNFYSKLPHYYRKAWC